MSTPSELIEAAFQRLSQQPGFVDRPFQQHLALLLSDLIGEGSTGAFEAPTGLGKSLAALIPAIAHAIAGDKRIVIATYTNVLAEQYWRSDLPLALGLFAPLDPPVKAQLLMGRGRYACMASIREHLPERANIFRREAVIGHEADFRKSLAGEKQLGQLWQKVATPPVCPGRLCTEYDECFYYRARRSAEKANIVITNHSVVIQDAVMSASTDSDGLLGKYDFLILDEAHDFPQAAINGLEFELSVPRLQMVAAISTRLEETVEPLASMAEEAPAWIRGCTRFREGIEQCERAMVGYGLELGRSGILTATPKEVLDHPQVQGNMVEGSLDGAQQIADHVGVLCNGFVKGVGERLDRWREAHPELGKASAEMVRNYVSYIRDFGGGAHSVFQPQGVAVSYAGRNGQDPMFRQDLVALAEPLRELLWDRVPYACMSATLALDESFDYFLRTTGASPSHQEILPSPFDFTHQAALYLPPEGSVPDPTVARRNGTEDEYHAAVARELSEIILQAGGRTLALFHSRREMEGVMANMNLPPELPILIQSRSGASTVGERFVKNVHASLFALRSFWTGFDAPGETLSVVALVRVPFEVPTDPPQIARMAYLQTQGLDAFFEHTLPLAKMLMRQGAGRLIRRDGDKGIIALLDPRLQTKRYGEAILDNLPPGMRTFRDIRDAIGWIGLEV